MHWIAVKELSDYFAMANEESLASFPVNSTLQTLLKLLQQSDGYNAELEMMIVRCVLNLYEILSPTYSPSIIQEFIPILLSKLYSIEYIDLAEACISLLLKVSVYDDYE